MIDFDLDDVGALERNDPSGVLRQVAGAGAAVRGSLAVVPDDFLAAIRSEGRPRAVVLCGAGVGRAAADTVVELSVASPVPIVAVGPSLPAWVGPLDLVLFLGDSPDSADGIRQAGRRGARIIAIGSGHVEEVSAARGAVVPAFSPLEARDARPGFWALLTPALLVAGEVGAVAVHRGALAGLADQLDEAALAHGPRVPLGENIAKDLGLALADSAPVIWGTTGLSGLAAARLAEGLNRHAKKFAVHAVVDEAVRTHLAVLDAGTASASDDIFRDPFEDPTGSEPVRVVLLDGRDRESAGSDPDLARALGVIENRGVLFTEVLGVGRTPLERFSSLVATADFAAVYAALAAGRDPAPGGAVEPETPSAKER